MATKGGGYVVVYKHQHFSIVDNRLAMEKTYRFQLSLRYGTLAQHF